MRNAHRGGRVVVVAEPGISQPHHEVAPHTVTGGKIPDRAAADVHGRLNRHLLVVDVAARIERYVVAGRLHADVGVDIASALPLHHLCVGSRPGQEQADRRSTHRQSEHHSSSLRSAEVLAAPCRARHGSMRIRRATRDHFLDNGAKRPVIFFNLSHSDALKIPTFDVPIELPDRSTLHSGGKTL